MLEQTFARFYRRLSQWQPPGEGSVYLCGSCFGSRALAEDGVLTRMPHAVIHELIADLLRVVEQLYVEQMDEYEARAAALPHEFAETYGERMQRMAAYARLAEARVFGTLIDRFDEIELARERYIEPRLNLYVVAELGDS